MARNHRPGNFSEWRMDLKSFCRGHFKLFIFFPALFLIQTVFTDLLLAQERIVGEGVHSVFIISEGLEVLKVSPIQPGQTIQIAFIPRWTAEKNGKVEWSLEDQNGQKLRTGSQYNPGSPPANNSETNPEELGENITEATPPPIEWTSNSEPRPSGYFIRIQGTGGNFAGEIIGQVTVRILLWNQNDANSGGDAPEKYEKALLIPASEPGEYLYDECFASGTADNYDIYKVMLKPNHSLTLRAAPLQWKGTGDRGKVHWEFLDKSFKKLKEGNNVYKNLNPFAVKIFHPQVKSSTNPALYYLLVKVEGDVSLIYSLHVEIKEGR